MVCIWHICSHFGATAMHRGHGATSHGPPRWSTKRTHTISILCSTSVASRTCQLARSGCSNCPSHHSHGMRSQERGGYPRSYSTLDGVRRPKESRADHVPPDIRWQTRAARLARLASPPASSTRRTRLISKRSSTCMRCGRAGWALLGGMWRKTSRKKERRSFV